MCRSSSLLTQHLGHPGCSAQKERVSADPAAVDGLCAGDSGRWKWYSVHWEGKAEESFMVLPSSPVTSKWMASEFLGLLSCRFGFHVLALFYSFSVLPLCTSSSLALLDHPSSPTVGRGSVSVCIYFFFFCYLETFTVW